MQDSINYRRPVTDIASPDDLAGGRISTESEAARPCSFLPVWTGARRGAIVLKRKATGRKTMNIDSTIYENGIDAIERWVKRRASEFVIQLEPPERIVGVPFAELEASARRDAPPGDAKRNCSVHLIVTPDFRRGALGEGQEIRPVEQLVSYLWREGPKAWQDREWAIKAQTVRQPREKWKNQAEQTRELIRASGVRVYYVIVAEGSRRRNPRPANRQCSTDSAAGWSIHAANRQKCDLKLRRLPPSCGIRPRGPLAWRLCQGSKEISKCRRTPIGFVT